MRFCLGSLALAVFGVAVNSVVALKECGSGRCFCWAASRTAAERVLGLSRPSLFEVSLQDQDSISFHSYFGRLG